MWRSAPLLCLLAACSAAPAATHTVRAFPPTFDAPLRAVLASFRVPAASVAVTYRGRLVFARGYGHARGPGSAETTVHTRFRIASLTKPITSVAVHQLHAQGRLDLETEVFALLELTAPTDGTLDERFRTITVRHLLDHSGGFDRMRSFDPMFANLHFAKERRRSVRADDLDGIIDEMLRRPLDFDPGTEQAYSNFGYALLGRVIERVTGLPYERFVREEVLAPMGITRMEIGRELPGDRPLDEAFYFPDPTESLLPNLFSEVQELVSPADGGFFMRPMEAHGGFIASATDYARFLVHVDGLPSPPDVLPPTELDAMLARPGAFVPEDAQDFYAHGFDVILTREGRIYSHTGAKPGTVSLAVVLPSGVSYVVLANTRPLDRDLTDALDEAMLEIIGAAEAFPDIDLFAPGGLPTRPDER